MKTSWTQRWSEEWGRLPTERELREFNRYAIRWAIERGLETNTSWREQIKRDRESTYRKNNIRHNTMKTETKADNKPSIITKPVVEPAEAKIEHLKAEIRTLQASVIAIRGERDRALQDAREGRISKDKLRDIAKLCGG